MVAMTIRRAESGADYEAAKALILEYVEWLAEDFCTHRFDEELASIGTMYGPPDGALLLAFDGEAPVGCIAYRRHAEGECEMKRLYVVPVARGTGLGKRLVCDLVEAAKSHGYRRMVLDTLPKLETAIALYRKLGFVEIEPFYDNPIEGVTFMALELSDYSDSV